MEIWINPACSKCQSALSLLDEEDAQYTVRYYLEDPPTAEELDAVLRRLTLEPWDITRTGEAGGGRTGPRGMDARSGGPHPLDRGAGRPPRVDPAADHHRRRRHGSAGTVSGVGAVRPAVARDASGADHGPVSRSLSPEQVRPTARW